MKVNKKLYPEYKEIVNKKILERYGDEISDNLKKCLEEFLKRNYLEEFLKRNDLEEKLIFNSKVEVFLNSIFGNDKISKIRGEYFKYARKVLKEDKKEIEKEFSEKVEENNEKILENEKVKKFLIKLKYIGRYLNNLLYEIQEFSERTRIQIAKIAAENNGEAISEYIKEYEISDEKERIEIAKIAAQNNGCAVSKYIENYKISSEEARIEIAKIAAQNNGGAVLRFIENYKISSEEARIQIVKIVAQNNGGAVLRFIENYKISSEKARIEIAKIAAENNGEAVSEYIKEYEISDEKERIEIAKIAAENNGEAVSKYIKEYEISDEKERIEIAKIAAENNGEAVSKYIENYKISSEKARIEIAKIAIQNDIRSIRFLENYNIGLKNIDLGEINTAKKFIEEINKLAGDVLAEEKIRILSVYGENSRLENIKWLFDNLLFDDIEGYGLKDLDYEGKQKYLYLKYLGFNEDFINKFVKNKKISKAAYDDFMTYAINIYKKLGKDFFKNIIFTPDLVSGRNIIPVIELLRLFDKILNVSDIGYYKKEYIDSLKYTLKHFLTKEIKTTKNVIENTTKALQDNVVGPISSLEDSDKLNITNENIEIVKKILEDIFLTYFRLVFRLNGKTIENKEIIELEKKWGDLEVLYTLISRFSKISSGKKEIPYLSKIIEILLKEGEEGFKRYKYFGEGGTEEEQELSKRQLKYLSNNQIKKWMENPSNLKYVSTKKEGEITDEELLKIAKGEVLEQLIRQRHLDLVYDGLVEDVNNFDENDKNYQSLLEKIKADKKIKVNEILKSLSGTKKEKTKFLTKALFYILKTTEDKKIFEKVLSILNGGIPRKNLQKIKEDLKSIKSKLYPVEKGNEVFIFTTIFDNPKFLLEIGDLVDTFSCQNYKTGEYVENLLGYVIDANIKGVISFAIDKGYLNGNQRLFDKIKEELKEGKLDYEFDAPKRILKLKLSNGEEIKIQLKKAIGRRVIKLGYKNQEAKIFTEREYNSTHYARKYISEEINELVNKFAENIGIKRVKGGIRIAGTKNPGGVYSDAAGGVMYDNYWI